MAFHRHIRLPSTTIPSRPPCTFPEAVAYGDLLQSMVPDSADPAHHAFVVFVDNWQGDRQK